MSRFIDADAYIKANACVGYLDEISVEKFNKITPTADVRENKRGKWGTNGECPFCGYLRQWEDDNYCGNCGAVLRKGLDHEND